MNAWAEAADLAGTVLLFLGGFLTIAGEWFRMWANNEVNASPTALQNFLIAGVGLILVHLPDKSSGSLCRSPRCAAVAQDR